MRIELCTSYVSGGDRCLFSSFQWYYPSFCDAVFNFPVMKLDALVYLSLNFRQSV
jgi:hypothetical protein